MRHLDKLLLILDFLGTLVFAVEGGTAGMKANLDVLGIVVLAFTTAVGGGTVRDMLLAQVPTVLRADVYASAALAGAIVTVVGLKLKWNPVLVTAAGAAFCFLLRLVAVWQHWNLPKVMLR